MRLSDAAGYFDKTAATDPVSGAALFMGQIDPFDDSKRDASPAYRRILSVKPGTTMPTGLVARMLGLVWIIGSMEPDGLHELHREKRVVQRVTGQLKVSRLSGFLAGTVASTLWASAQWLKDTKQIDTSSDLPQIYEIGFPDNAAVSLQDVVWDSTDAYLVLATHRTASGFLNANCLKLEQAVPATASLVTRTYNPVTGVYANSVGVSVKALAVRWQSMFMYESMASDKYVKGDLAIVLPTGTAASNSSLLTLAGVTYQTLAVNDVSGAVVLHARGA